MVEPSASIETRTERKRRQVVDAATECFLEHGYERTSMDTVARAAGVSKQTVYHHFDTKADLLRHVVTSVIETAGADADAPIANLAESDDVERDLRAYARAQLRFVIQPAPMRLRRLIVAEARQFPELAELYFELGPRSAIDQLAVVVERLDEREILRVPDPARAAADLNWLVLSDALNRAMLLGSDEPLSEHQIRTRSEHAIATFLAAYQRRR
ncbi:MAG: TetR family transcriptional regulator [Acidimicrobiaceae bacterium]|nr:TetR family transcriptional regulator [Acidimicrobiaceae bacterium]